MPVGAVVNGYGWKVMESRTSYSSDTTEREITCANGTVSGVIGGTGTKKGSRASGVARRARCGAVVVPVGAVVDRCAGGAGARVASVAGAGVRPRTSVGASGTHFGAIVSSIGAVVCGFQE